MGRKLTKVEFVPGVNEQIETTITLQKEERSVIHGVVLDERKRPVRDAVVKLFELPNQNNCCTLIPLFHSFTDECGQFLFGPLHPGKRYVVKVWHKEVHIRQVPGTHFDCKNPCSEPTGYSDCDDGRDCTEPDDNFPSCSSRKHHRHRDNFDSCGDYGF